jgi:hypothetical protein
MAKQLIPTTINATGVEEIRAFLVANHNKPELYERADSISMRMLRAWAQEAEFSLGEGNDASIELKARDSIHGRTQTFTISASGVDSVEFDSDEE